MARTRSLPLRAKLSPSRRATAVVRVDVRYGDPVRQEYRDLWVMTFDSAGTCQSFEEWPFWPGRPYSAHGTDSAP